MMYETPDDFIIAIDFAEDDEEWQALAKHLMQQIVKSSDSNESSLFVQAVILRLPSCDTKRLLNLEVDGWTALEKASFASAEVMDLISSLYGETKRLSDRSKMVVDIVGNSPKKAKPKQKIKRVAKSSKVKSKGKQRSS